LFFKEVPHLFYEWDYTRNEIDPNTVTAGSNYKAWWLCQRGHSWQANVNSRVQGAGCPKCAIFIRKIEYAKKHRALKFCKNTDLSYREIGRRLGISRQTIMTWCREAGIRKTRKEIMKEKKRKALKLCRTQNLTFKEIGRRAGVSPQKVSEWCYRAGIREPSPEVLARRRKQAFELYITTTLSFDEIARRVGLPKRVVETWLLLEEY
jgi:DNA-directed RNA polymerase specialized sigma24 family protein